MDSHHRQSQRRPKQKATPMDTHRNTATERRKPVKRRVIVRRPKPVPKSPFRTWMAALAASATLLGAAALIVGGAGLGVQLIVNPDATTWVNQYLPEWTRIGVTEREPIQTLDQIRAGISKKGLIPGATLPLSSEETAEFLLAVSQRRSECQTDCEQIVELRVYQPAEAKDKNKHYQLVNKVAIAGPEESAVMASLGDEESNNRRSSRSLPLTQLSRFEGKVPEPGVWLNLKGKVQGNAGVTYGQVLHYNPATSHLSVMVSWRSPTGQVPHWQEVTGGDASELVVDQTVGLEPLFRVYQIKQRNFQPDPVYLEEISLAEPAFNTQEYRNALILARNGLWSSALEWLQSQKSKEWSDSAQAQMDLMRLHAQVTQEKSKKPWASPAEQVLVNLIDGRWQDALQVFQVSEGPQRSEIVNMLKADSTYLWKRVEAAMKVNPGQSEVQAWGALIVAAKQGRQSAIAWVSQQPQKTLFTVTRINQLLDLMDAPWMAAVPANSHVSQIIGSAKLALAVNQSDWQQPEASPGSSISPLQLSDQQVWYQLQVATFNDGQRWRQQPFTDLSVLTAGQALQLWKLLGLDMDPQIQIALWKPDGRKETKIATVKAAQIKNGVLQLLAAGEAFPGITPPSSNPESKANSKPKAGTSSPSQQKSKLSGASFLATSEKALQWLDPNSITLAQLSQSQPQWAALILPTLWSELQTAHLQPVGSIPNLQAMVQAIGNWPVQIIDLTGNGQPEVVLTLYPAITQMLKNPGVKPPLKSSLMFKRRTMIFADTGALIYSEFTASPGESVAAIADPGDGGPPALVVQSSKNYTIKRWSLERQRFE